MHLPLSLKFKQLRHVMRVRCQKKTLQKVSKIKYVEFYKKLVEKFRTARTYGHRVQFHF